jgi:hypothetical protein
MPELIVIVILGAALIISFRICNALIARERRNSQYARENADRNWRFVFKNMEEDRNSWVERATDLRKRNERQHEINRDLIDEYGDLIEFVREIHPKTYRRFFG